MYQEKVNMKIITSLIILVIFILVTTTNTYAVEVESDIDPVLDLSLSLNQNQNQNLNSEENGERKSQQILTIESKVTGSQEQPKVLYIMPWQGITNPITIKDKEMQLTLPKFQPINPKIFKKEVRDFAVNQAQAKPLVRQK